MQIKKKNVFVNKYTYYICHIYMNIEHVKGCTSDDVLPILSPSYLNYVIRLQAF